MSNDISYVVKVQDSFSKNTKKFSQQIDIASKKVAAFDNQLKKIQGNLNLNFKTSGSSFEAILKPLNQIQQKLKEFSYGANSTLGKVQRGNQRIIKSNKELAKSFAEVKSASGGNSAVVVPIANNDNEKKEGFGTGLKRRALNLAEYGGLYYGSQTIVNTAKNMYENAKKMDSARASLSAVAPRAKGFEGQNGEELAKSEMQYLRDVAEKFGANFKEIVNPYVKILSTSTLDQKDTKKVFESFIGYQALTGKSAEETKGVLFAIEQMLTKKRISGQEYNLQLANMAGHSDIFAEALSRAIGKKVTPGQFLKMMSQPNAGISSNILTFAADIMNERYGKQELAKSHTIQGEENRLSNAFNELSTTLTDVLKPTLIGSITSLTSGIRNVEGFFSTAFNSETAEALNAMWQQLNSIGRPNNIVEKFQESQKNKRPLFPNIDLGNPLTWGQSFGRKAFEDDVVQQFLESEKNKQPLFPGGDKAQEVAVKVTFENAPKGTTYEVENKSKGSLGKTTEGY